jgi:hypothetical protein
VSETQTYYTRQDRTCPHDDGSPSLFTRNSFPSPRRGKDKDKPEESQSSFWLFRKVDRVEQKKKKHRLSFSPLAQVSRDFPCSRHCSKAPQPLGPRRRPLPNPSQWDISLIPRGFVVGIHTCSEKARTKRRDTAAGWHPSKPHPDETSDSWPPPPPWVVARYLTVESSSHPSHPAFFCCKPPPLPPLSLPHPPPSLPPHLPLGEFRLSFPFIFLFLFFLILFDSFLRREYRNGLGFFGKESQISGVKKKKKKKKKRFLSLFLFFSDAEREERKKKVCPGGGKTKTDGRTEEEGGEEEM